MKLKYKAAMIALAGALGMIGMSKSASANSIIVSNLDSVAADGSITVGSNTYTVYKYTYDISLTGFNAMSHDLAEGFTLRDFNGFVGGSASFAPSVAGTTYTFSQSFLGGFGTVGTADDPTQINLTETLTTGTVNNNSSASNLLLGVFTAKSIYGTPVLPNATTGPLIGGLDDASPNADPYPGPAGSGGPTTVGLPLPASAWGGMGLFGLLVAFRFRRGQNAMA